MWLAERYISENFLDDVVLDQFIRDLSKIRKLETWNLDMQQLQRFIKNSKKKNYQDVCWLVHQFYARTRSKGRSVLGDKNNFYIDYLPRIKDLFPKAGVIYIVRDGRDVACSYIDLATKKIDSIYAPRLPFEVSKIAKDWVSNNSLLIREMDENVALVKYEDLVTKPEQELMRLCCYLGLPYADQMLKYHIKNQVEQQEPSEFMQWKAKTLEAPDANNVGKYQSLLTPEQIKEFNSIAGPVLKYFGYKDCW